MNNEIEPRENGDFNVKTDFSTWDRKTLERFAREAAYRIHELTVDNKIWQEAWRKATINTPGALEKVEL